MLQDIIFYFLQKNKELPNARITKLVYLLDWEYSLKYGRQLTNIEWFFDYYWPFVRDIENVISENSDIFKVKTYTNLSWNSGKFFSTKWEKSINLDKNVIDLIDSIIQKTKDLTFNEFIKYVYSTYPVYKTRQFNKLNLVELAQEFNSIKK